MTLPTSIIDIASFGAYPAYLAARLDGLKTALGLNQLEVYGSNARFVEGGGDEDETVEIGPIDHVVNLNPGALRETPVELWGNETWVQMSAVATCSLDIRTSALAMSSAAGSFGRSERESLSSRATPTLPRTLTRGMPSSPSATTLSRDTAPWTPPPTSNGMPYASSSRRTSIFLHPPHS